MGLIFMRLKCKGFKILTESTNFVESGSGTSWNLTKVICENYWITQE